MADKAMTVTRQEVQAISEEAANKAADKAIRGVLLAMGVDISDDEAVLKMQADFRHLRVWRESVDDVKRKTLLTAIGVIVTGVAGYLLIVFGFKAG